MKKIIGCSFFILIFLLILPLSVIKKPKTVAAASTDVSKVLREENTYSAETFRILDSETDTVTEMPAKEYIFGVLAAEMPALYDVEALKAQAVAAYTFALSRRMENADKDYDITTDFKSDQSFITKEKAREKWGEKADEYCSKLNSVIDEVENLAVTYKGKPILALYHAISSGKTEDCKNVWGKDYPYLKAVASPCDTLSPNYISKETFSAEEVKMKLSKEAELSGEPQDYFGKAEYTASNTVKSIKVCGRSMSGAQMRSIFSLRSSSFEIAYNDGEFTFTVYGYGHGVGMSQYGADYMAKQGSDFKEILLHYYSGCRVEKLS